MSCSSSRLVAVELRLGAQHGVRSGDDADAGVPQGEQVTGGDEAAGPVVGLYGEVVGGGVAGRVERDIVDVERLQA